MEHSTRPEPTRILLVSPLPPPLGGMQTWTETLLRRGLPEPFAVDLVNTRQPGRRRKRPGPRLTYGEAARFFKILWRCYSALRSGRYALVHMNSSFTRTATLVNLCTMWIACHAGVPYVVHLHGTFRVPGGSASRLYRSAYRRIFDSAAWILLLGQPSQRAVRALGSYDDKTTGLMPNFIDFGSVPPRSGTALRAGDHIKVVYTGRIWAPKGIATIARVAERVRNAIFQLVGDGPAESRDAFIRDLESRRLLDRVAVLEARPNEDVLAPTPMSSSSRRWERGCRTASSRPWPWACRWWRPKSAPSPR